LKYSIYKDDGLNWSNVLRNDFFQISLQVKRPKTYLTLYCLNVLDSLFDYLK